MEKCPICLEILEDNLTTTNCNHKFCNMCFDKLLDTNKTECPLCRTELREYSNNYEKVRILIKTKQTNSFEINNLNINARLLTIREIRRYSLRNYLYSLLILYICYSYINCSYMVNELSQRYENCLQINNNITETCGLFKETVSVTLYNFEENELSNICRVPTYFYNQCFNL